jgi:hypothetical protein
LCSGQQPGSGLHRPSEFAVDPLQFELGRSPSDNPHTPGDLLVNGATACRVVEKNFPKLGVVEEEQFWREIDAMIKLQNSVIVSFSRFDLQTSLNNPRIATYFMPGGPIKDIFALRSPPEWETGGAKSIVVAGVVSRRFLLTNRALSAVT